MKDAPSRMVTQKLGNRSQINATLYLLHWAPRRGYFQLEHRLPGHPCKHSHAVLLKLCGSLEDLDLLQSCFELELLHQALQGAHTGPGRHGGGEDPSHSHIFKILVWDLLVQMPNREIAGSYENLILIFSIIFLKCNSVTIKANQLGE